MCSCVQYNLSPKLLETWVNDSSVTMETEETELCMSLIHITYMTVPHKLVTLFFS